MGLFDFSRRSSGSYAKDRLKYLLISDKTDCSRDVLYQIERDILDVLSRYFEIDANDLQIQIVQVKSEQNKGAKKVLQAYIPIRNMNTKTIR